MSSSDRRAFLTLLAALPAAACGFQPAYAPGAPARALFNKVKTDDPGDKASFDLVGRLEERLGRPEEPIYRLTYGISVSSVGLGITPSNATTRYNLNGTANYSLRRVSDDKVLASGGVRNFTSFSATGTVVATAASERDALRRLMWMLADQIVTDLIVKSSGWTAAQ